MENPPEGDMSSLSIFCAVAASMYRKRRGDAGEDVDACAEFEDMVGETESERVTEGDCHC